ncbi:ferric reductase-like transmembrane domain-containing protein [Zobellella sp. DQSA1]|uniref:ferredoxin reductase family protein n=1 Tax=Zobellella sp. DQSA1 TaxID=3342386 RepID=UPI0035BEB857
MHQRPTPGEILAIALILLPLIAALPRLRDGYSSEWSQALISLGRISGILGLAMMLVTAALSVRLPLLDACFGGLPRMWRLHRRLGFGAFMLILLHVLLLAFAALPHSLSMAVALLFPPLAEWLTWAGWLALVTLVVFLAPTFQFFGPIHYQNWKRLHLLSVPTLALALLHTLPPLASPWPWWLLATLAALALLWRKGLSPWLARKPYRVTEVSSLAPDVVEITLLPERRPLRHKAGQFVYLSPLDDGLATGRGEEHPYTLSSAPGAPELKLGIKALGDASRALQSVALGSRVLLEGPYGAFFEQAAPGRKRLWLGGGIGITPFVAAARALAADPGKNEEVVLCYLANRPERAYYLEELADIAARHPSLRLVPHYFSERGPLELDFLEQHCPDFRERELLICGPPPMIHHLLRLLAEAGVPRHHIHTEAFDFL